MEHLYEFLWKNMGDHYLNFVGSILFLASVLGFSFLYLSSVFIFKTGFKLSNIRRLHANPSDKEIEEKDLNLFGRIWNFLLWACVVLVIAGGIMMVIPFGKL